MNNWFDFDPVIDIDDPNETLGQAIPMTAILDRFNIDYTPTGQNQYKTLCLWHEDSNPSLYIYEATHSYHCFACQANGTLITLMSKLMGYTGTSGTLGYNLAIKELCMMAGITSGESLVQFTPPPKRKPEESIEYWVIRAGQEIRKHLKTKEGRKGYDSWSVWADAKFKRMDRMLDCGDDELWEKAKQLYDVTVKQIRGGK